MIYRRVLYGCALGLALSLPLQMSQTQPVTAQNLAARSSQSSSQIRSLQLVPSGEQLKLEVDIDGSSRPQVFFTQRGTTWVGDITNAQLAIEPGQTSYQQDNPAPGITRIEAQQIDDQSVRVQITGDAAAPQGLLTERSASRLIFDFEAMPDTVLTASSPQDVAAGAPPVQAIPVAPTSTSQPSDSADTTVVAQAAPTAPAEAPVTPATAPVAPSTLAPAASDPGVTLSQAPRIEDLDSPQLPPGLATPGASRFDATAIAPPTGDIAVGTIIPQSPPVDLGSNSTITLTLKDAPVSDVLSLLVRRAGLNVVLNDVPGDLTVSLDVQDAPLQETFEFITRLKGLQARRIEQTIFIGETLPGVSEQLVRSFRLNQAFVEDTTLSADGVPSALGSEGGQLELVDLEVRGVLPFLESLAAAGGPLEGVQLIGDVRTNSITAIGTAEQLDIVAAQIAQLDVRQRQAFINIRVVDVQLDDARSIGATLGGASGNFTLNGAGGNGGDAPPFGGTPIDQPAGSSVPNIGAEQAGAPVADGGVLPGTFVFNSLNRLQDALGIRIDAAVNQGTAKILADPKLLVADGGNSSVIIGQQIISSVALERDAATGATVTRPVLGNAGISLSLRNVRIDDNGFVTFDLTPQVSSPAETAQFVGVTITLLNQRTLNTQRIRVRDGDTLVLTGLIQENDTVTVDKVPLLGDIPLLGSLFRRQTTTNTRNEVIVMVTTSILKDDQLIAPSSISSVP